MSKPRTIIALFNYGGGMRGLVPAHLMARIEKVTGLPMTDMVDIFAGPSTGAILNAALNIPHPRKPHRPKYRARHMVRFYEHEGSKIFPRDRFRSFRGLIHDFNNRTMKISQLNTLFQHGHYDGAHLNQSLRTLYGEAKLSESLRSLVIPVYNIDGQQLLALEEKGETGETPVHTKNNFVDGGGHAVWLKHMQLSYNRKPTPDVRLHDAVMGSTAAPTYFRCHHFHVNYAGRRGPKEISAIDGSIFDNPCISYHGAIRQHLHEDDRLIMIVLGTGHTLRSFKKEDWNSYGGLGVVDPTNDLPLINILFHASETALIESFAQELGDNLFVFNKSLIIDKDHPDSPSKQIDDSSPEQLKKLRNFSEAILEENAAQFDKLCHTLVQHRDDKDRPGNGFWNGLRRKLLRN